MTFQLYIGKTKHGRVVLDVELRIRDVQHELPGGLVETETRTVLSISGMEGNQSAGQIISALDDIVEFQHPWGGGRERQVQDIWRRWHLNDLRAGCVHQREEDWGNEDLEVVTYGLTTEANAIRKKAERKAYDAGALGKVADLDKTEKALLACEWFKGIFTPPDADSPLSGCYEVKKRETKRGNWVKPSEHPRGILCKSCPTCGYEYGSAWLYEAMPQEVIDTIKSWDSWANNESEKAT